MKELLTVLLLYLHLRLSRLLCCGNFCQYIFCYILFISFCMHSCHVTLTDLPELTTLMEKNIEENQELLDGAVKASVLKWYPLYVPPIYPLYHLFTPTYPLYILSISIYALCFTIILWRTNERICFWRWRYVKIYKWKNRRHSWWQEKIICNILV